MTIRLFHQVGHNANWNRDSFVDDKCGDGLILSPLHQTRDQIEKLAVTVRKASLFDPQFYLPNCQKEKLLSFPFFPERLAAGYSDKKFAAVALDAARQCLAFQISMHFEKLVIPARYFGQMDPEYTEKQDAFSVIPFLKAVAEAKSKRPLYLTLPLTSHMVESPKYRTQLLNWVTGMPELAGVYTFAANERDTKQPASADFLTSYINFISDLRNAGLDVIAGHLNTEALLVTIVGGVAVTMGTFENTRTFSIDKFLAADDRRGPRARIYLPGLLNWIQIDQAKAIRKSSPAIWKKIYDPTPHGDVALDAAVEPTFNQPVLYKHHFISFQRQIDQLKPLHPENRRKLLAEWIAEATGAHKQVAKVVELEKHGGGSHLPGWKETILGAGGSGA